MHNKGVFLKASKQHLNPTQQQQMWVDTVSLSSVSNGMSLTGVDIAISTLPG